MSPWERRRTEMIRRYWDTPIQHLQLIKTSRHFKPIDGRHESAALIVLLVLVSRVIRQRAPRGWCIPTHIALVNTLGQSNTAQNELSNCKQQSEERVNQQQSFGSTKCSTYTQNRKGTGSARDGHDGLAIKRVIVNMYLQQCYGR